MLLVKEKYVCEREDKSYGRNHVHYLCQCECGRETIFSGGEIVRHSDSYGCTPKLGVMGSAPIGGIFTMSEVSCKKISY
ncbi:MAG: hypothetical protein SPG64_04150 [Candidatus Enteromonas sp.]|nr:hypothetical protein [Candidatus Enteromonas sp.]